MASDILKNHNSQMNCLHLYDSQTRKNKPVTPIEGDTLRFYCCGPTVYGPAHIGNFRTFVMQDVFRRVVESTGLKTRHVRNLTDVDDKTIRQSQAEGVSLGDFTAGWTEKFHKDSESLNLLPPHVEPSAVDHIPEQIEMIATLIEKGHAYRSDDGSVYFKVDSFEDYGKLSRLKEREITTNNVTQETEREDSDEYERESAADFVLWKSRKEEDGPNFWESPWGQGRPGWHLECSAMCKKHLGDSFDVHSGGEDLLFPHHENEIAQSECCNGTAFVNHWFHISHLMVDGAKMSKSLNNLYTIDQLEEMGHTAEEVRYVLLSGSYGQQLNFTLDSLKAAGKALERLRDFKEKLGAIPDGVATSLDDFGPFRPVIDALLNDLNTSDALGKLFSLIKQYQKEIPDLDNDTLNEARRGFAYCIFALGLKLDIPKTTKSNVPENVAQMAADRWEAKQNKDWAKSDELRDAIAAEGWQVKDTKEGYTVAPLA